MGILAAMFGRKAKSSEDGLRRIPGPYDDLSPAERWSRINADKKAAGCKCGRPATHVRRYGGTIGGVPSEVWTCEEHRNVNGWSRVGDGPWVPTDDVTPETEAWRV